jgi:hypothetical protein
MMVIFEKDPPTCDESARCRLEVDELTLSELRH